MKSEVLVLDSRRTLYVVIVSLLLSLFFIPLSQASAQGYSQASYYSAVSTQTREGNISNVGSLKDLIAQLRARLDGMKRGSMEPKADKPSTKSTELSESKEVASTSAVKDKRISADYIIVSVSNNKFPVLTGKVKTATTATIIIEDSDGAVVYTKEQNKFRKGNWVHKVTESLTAGTYKAILEVDGVEVSNKEFRIGRMSDVKPIKTETSEANSNETTTESSTTTPKSNTRINYSQSSYFPSGYTFPSRSGSVRGASTSNPEEMLTTILIGLVDILESLE